MNNTKALIITSFRSHGICSATLLSIKDHQNIFAFFNYTKHFLTTFGSIRTTNACAYLDPLPINKYVQHLVACIFPQLRIQVNTLKFKYDAIKLPDDVLFVNTTDYFSYKISQKLFDEFSKYGKSTLEILSTPHKGQNFIVYDVSKRFLEVDQLYPDFRISCIIRNNHVFFRYLDLKMGQFKAFKGHVLCAHDTATLETLSADLVKNN